ncbi:T6SS immunity protein Tdi1 domain-containing protein [Bacillus spongiae]|uniref:T6SS immunity protein Tdi1 domain-containing protein n=1 Tax=Bacillus spongiae TaxID=2683610 RepID=A0ABU8HKM7_9BACI
MLEIPCNFTEFHNEEIPIYHDACLASSFYNEWLSKQPMDLSPDECIGYKVLLFLGGEDTISNLEKGDMVVYWNLCSQIIRQTKDLSEGNVINFNLGN